MKTSIYIQKICVIIFNSLLIKEHARIWEKVAGNVSLRVNKAMF